MLFKLVHCLLVLASMPTFCLSADISPSPEASPKTKSIAFTPPQKWQMADTKALPSSVKVMVVGHSKSSFPPSINLGMAPYQGSILQYVKDAKNKSQNQGCQLINLGNITTEAGEVTLCQEEIPTKWGNIKYMYAFLHRDNNIYILTAAATKEEFSQHYKQFLEAFRSLRFIETN